VSALITSIIPVQNFELIRDAIGVILATELANQQTLIEDDGGEFTAPEVWVDRYVTLDKTELPAVVVTYGNGEYANQTQIVTEGTYTYFIDTYCNAETEDDTDGYRLSMAKVDRIMGMIRYILSSPFYKTLGFQAGFILNRTIQSMGVFSKQDVQDALSDGVGRLVFTVRVTELQSGQPIADFDGIDTIFYLSDTGEGYKLITDFN
jgi:hypothetical protein